MTEISSPYPAPQQKSKNKTALFIGIVLVLILLAGGLFLFRQSSQKEPEKAAVTETIAPPSPTAKPVIDKTTVTIQVTNGTGTPGQAGTAVEALKKAGYSADNIKTVNADKFDATATTISAKAGFEDTAKDIKEALQSTFSDITIETSELESSSEFDIVIVTGGKKFEEPTTEPSTTPGTSSTPSPTNASTPSPSPSITPTP